MTSSGQDPFVQSLISAIPGLTFVKTYRANPGLALIGLWTSGPCSLYLICACEHIFARVIYFCLRRVLEITRSYLTKHSSCLVFIKHSDNDSRIFSLVKEELPHALTGIAYINSYYIHMSLDNGNGALWLAPSLVGSQLRSKCNPLPPDK